MLNVGSLDRRVDIQSETRAATATSDAGAPTWTNYATDVPAKMDYRLSGGVDETHEAMQKVNIQVNNWLVRYDSGITPKMRLVYEGEYYYIVRMREVGRRRGLVLTTELRDN